MKEQKKDRSRFEQATAASQERGGIFGELWGFVRANKRWWMIPVVVLLLMFGLLVLLSSTAAAPFIYTLF
jgi:hypothetical protein